MGSSYSKTDAQNGSPFQDQLSQDSLLTLLNKATTQKETEYKEFRDKLNKKLENATLSKNSSSGPNQSAFLNLKTNKLELKLSKQKDQYQTETKIISTIREIYTDQKEKLRKLDNEKTIQLADLNLQIAGLNVDIDNLKQKLKDEEVSYKAKLQEKDFEYSAQNEIVATLKRKQETVRALNSASSTLRVELANSKHETSLLKTREQELRTTFQNKFDDYFDKNRALESKVLSLREANIKLDADQTKFKQEIMYLKTQINDLNKRQVDGVTMNNEVVRKYNTEVQKNTDARKEIDNLNLLLINHVKLIALQQRGVFLQIKQALQGLKVDLQYLIPHLNGRTIPTLQEGYKEMDTINGLLNKSQESLNLIIAYQGRFDSFINSKQSLAGIENVPNFLSGMQLPCSFLHVKFLPMFKITFSMVLPQNTQNNHFPTPLLDLAQTQRANADNRNHGAYQKSRQFSPRNNQGPNNGNVRGGRGGPQQGNNRRRPPRNNSSQSKSRSANKSDDSDESCSAGVTLTVLTTNSKHTDAAKKLSISAEKTECVICCESLRNPLMSVKLLEHCSHKYHTSCIDEWFESNTECPECAREDD